MTIRKRITTIMNQMQEVSNQASNLDKGTQFKIADRVLGNYEFSEEEPALENLLDAIVTECMYAREECK